MNIYITSALAKELALKPTINEENIEGGTLFDWHAHIFEFGKKKGVILTNGKTKYTLVIYYLKKNDFKKLESIIKEHLEKTLICERLMPSEITKFLSGDFMYYKGKNRSMTSTNTRNLIDLSYTDLWYNTHLDGAWQLALNHNSYFLVGLNGKYVYPQEEFLKEVDRYFNLNREEEYQKLSKNDKLKYDELALKFIEFGQYYLEQGEEDLAIMNFKRALIINPRLEDVKTQLLKMQDDSKKIIEGLKNAATLQLKWLEKEHGITIQNSKGLFYMILETRSYMRILENLMLEYCKISNYKEAIDICQQMLELSESDNLGNRFIYPYLLAYDNKFDELEKFFGEKIEGTIFELIQAFKMNNVHKIDQMYESNNQTLMKLINEDVAKLIKQDEEFELMSYVDPSFTLIKTLKSRYLK